MNSFLHFFRTASQNVRFRGRGRGRGRESGRGHRDEQAYVFFVILQKPIVFELYIF